MIDWQNEQVIPIREVRKYVTSRTPGKRVSPSTVWRWAIQKNNPLETFTVGGGRFTSVEAIRSGGSQVYGYDFQTGTESLVADAPNEFASSTLPDVSGNSVVYQSSLAVYVKNTATNTTTRIGGNEALRSAASTTGNYVVYEHRPNLSTFGDIYGYDITTGQEFAIATGVASQQNPDVSDRYVVWEDGRTNAPGIYGFDLVTRQEFLIATGNISNPAVDGNLVVWQESFGDGRESIRAAYVPEPAMAGVVMGGAALALARRRRT